MTFDRPDYEAWRKTRFDFIVAHYGAEFFAGKSLVEVGAGYGHLGNMFYELGAKVLSSDAREDNLLGIQARFPHLRTELCDLEVSFPAGHFDIGIHTGVLYHLSNPEEALIRACVSCDRLVLETETLDSQNIEGSALMVERKELPDAALSGKGLRLSAAHIESILVACGKSFLRCDDGSLNSGCHKYDWEVQGTETYGPHLRRFWFIQ